MELSPSRNLGFTQGSSTINEINQDDNFNQNLLDAHILRKKAEEDAQLLQNRIALLEMEEIKANRKIDETRKKAIEIMQLKQRNRQIEIEKQEQQKQKDQEQQKQREYINYVRETQKMNVDSKKQNYLNKIKNEVQNIKDSMKNNKNIIQEELEEELMRNTHTAQIIKNQQKELELKKLRALEEKTLKAQEDYKNRIVEENKIRVQKENEIRRLEQREMELIKKLQNTQNVQKQEFENLEKILSSDIDELKDLTATLAIQKQQQRSAKKQ